MNGSELHEFFNNVARRASQFVGTPTVFGLALSAVLLWALTGPIFGYSDTWQLVINTSTTIITFLMIFLVQNTQNRDSRAIHLKLDELIRTIEGARNALIDLEETSDENLDELQREFEEIQSRGGVGAEDVLGAISQIRRSRKGRSKR